MRRSFVLLTIPLLAAATGDFKEVDASKLPSVPGPSTTRMADPARDLAFTGLDAKIRTQSRHTGIQPAGKAGSRPRSIQVFSGSWKSDPAEARKSCSAARRAMC